MQIDTDGSGDECAFCIKFGQDLTDERKWYDAILVDANEFVVVPAVGPFRPGYLMVVTRTHLHSMAWLSAEQLRQLDDLHFHIRSMLSSVFSPAITFEHGSVTSDSSSGSCIDHAHLQFLPLDLDLLPRLRRDFDMRRICDLTALTELRDAGRPYLFFEDQDGQMYVGTSAHVPGQYMRRIIAEGIGCTDQWDYVLYPNYPVVAATVAQVEAWLAERPTDLSSTELGV